MSTQDFSGLGQTADNPFGTFLEIQTSGGGAQQVSLDAGTTWRIGRTPQNDVMFPEDSVSRQHAIIQKTQDGQYYLLDVGSSNGSFVNGGRISVPMSLKDGDLIQIGARELIFRSRTRFGIEQIPSDAIEFDATRMVFNPQRITVLVVDVRDFTKLTQLVDQSVLCRAVGTWFRKGGNIMQQRGSTSLKYIGDAIMAVWQHQRPGHEHEEIMGVLSAYVELAQVSAGLASEFSLPFEFRIGAGLNTGIASIGNTGGSGLMDFTAMGDTVNAAFRIESATKQVGVDVAIGNGTCKALAQSFQPELCFQPHQVHLKGYDAPTDIWGATLEAVQGFVWRGNQTTAFQSLRP